ncbi:hypothetical protein HWV62_44931 [Athelia sp. TMB]|nr:hypothetical protein HWV62_44931 [Athelia sp. TMB]
MMQRRQKYGLVPEEEEEDAEELHVFMDQYDLQKQPRGAYFSDLPASDLFALPSSTEQSVSNTPEREGAEGMGGEGSQDSGPEISSSLSGLPSSGSNPPDHAGSLNNVKSPSHTSNASMDIEGADIASLTRPSSPPAETEGPDTTSRPQSRTLSPQQLASVGPADEEDDDDRDELDIIGSLSPVHSRSQSLSLAPPTRTSTLEPPSLPPPLPSESMTASTSHQATANNEDDESDVDMALSDPEDDVVRTPVATNLTLDMDSSPHLMHPDTDPPAAKDFALRPVTPPQFLAPISVDLPNRHSPRYIAAPPSPLAGLPDFKFDVEPKAGMHEAENKHPVPPKQPRGPGHFNKTYKLPPLKVLPAEFHRKTKALKQQRKKEREREKNGKAADKDAKEEWMPMGINKWGATVRANPVYKKVGKATKCLSTRDWNISWTELRLIRTLERVELMKDAGRWSFRQPKKQRGTGGLTKTHWDFLMDEMRWMRTDFREERKWKMALAYNLSTAVLEWHAAGTLRERLIQGICVLWKRPRTDASAAEDSGNDAGSDQMDMDVDGDADEPSVNPMVDYNSSDNDDDEGDVEQKDVIDSLDLSVIVRDVLDDADAANAAQDEESQILTEIVRPKLEEREDASALRGGGDMEIDNPTPSKDNAISGAGDLVNISKTEDDTASVIPAGLKATSNDPILATVNTEPILKPSAKSNLYAPMRERVAYASVDKLFLDLDDYEDLVKDLGALSTGDNDYEDLVKDLGALSTGDSYIEPPPPPPDLSAIFPDLTPFGLLNVPSQAGTEGKKKSDKNKDDPNKRTEDTTYSRLMPIGEFMSCKPTLIGPLNPAKNWHDDNWFIQDEASTAVESDVPVVGDALCDLFGGVKPSMAPDRSFPLREPADARRRVAEQIWTSSDDVLLKTLVERYPNNWPLIADAFNSSRVTVSTDLRLPWDCYERYNTRWSGHSTTFKEPMSTSSLGDASPATASRDQMTTRGVKRLASVSAGVVPSPGGYTNEPSKKRRRHLLMSETIRKAAKKREANQKANGTFFSSLLLSLVIHVFSAAQKKSSAVHDTHGQYAKMPRYTPEQLSRMKSDKDQKDQDNLKLVMQQRQQQEMQRQQLIQQNGRGPVMR